MLIAQGKTKLDGGKSLFDLKTVSTERNKFDLDISPQGQAIRVIGISKLIQHVLKYMFVKKGTYSNPLVGTDMNKTSVQRTNSSLKSDIVTSLNEYSRYQVASSKIDSSILGWDIYRTQTPTVNTSWVKINKRLNSVNFYYDSSLINNGTYYYSVVVVRTVNGKPVSDGVGIVLGVTVPTTDTFNAVVGDSFTIIPRANAVTLYWPRRIPYQSEEILRSIVSLNTWFTPGEPRNLNISISLTNLDKVQTTVQTVV